jgi:signal peptidase II
VEAREVTVEPAPARPAARWRAVLPVLALAALILLADQLTKLWIVGAIGRTQAVHEIDLLPGWFVLQYVENTGAAFGMFRDGGWLLAGLAAVVVVVIVVTAPRMETEVGSGSARWRLLLSLGLVLGGAVGNLVDRILHSYVVDFIRVPVAQITLGETTYHFPNFNVADSAITVGILLLLLNLLLTPERKT